MPIGSVPRHLRLRLLFVYHWYNTEHLTNNLIDQSVHPFLRTLRCASLSKYPSVRAAIGLPLWSHNQMLSIYRQYRASPVPFWHDWCLDRRENHLHPWRVCFHNTSYKEQGHSLETAKQRIPHVICNVHLGFIRNCGSTKAQHTFISKSHVNIQILIHVTMYILHTVSEMWENEKKNILRWGYIRKWLPKQQRQQKRLSQWQQPRGSITAAIRALIKSFSRCILFIEILLW